MSGRNSAANERSITASAQRIASSAVSKLAFDHAALLEQALATLRDKVERGALPLHLLPAMFTLTDLQRAREAILGRDLDKGAFRRKLADQPVLVPVVGEFLRGPQRPAQLYCAASDFEF